MEYKTRFNFPINVGTITTVLSILIVIVIGYIFMYYLGSLGIADDPVTQAHINNTTAIWVVLAGVIVAVVTLSIILLLLKVLPKK